MCTKHRALLTQMRSAAMAREFARFFFSPQPKPAAGATASCFDGTEAHLLTRPANGSAYVMPTLSPASASPLLWPATISITHV